MNTPFRATDRFTLKIRRIARIWGTIILVITLFAVTGYLCNWVTIGVADPYAVEGTHPPIEYRSKKYQP